MTLSRRLRRRIDRTVAAAIAAVAVVLAVVVYLGSDARATTLVPTPAARVPSSAVPMTAPPTALAARWTLTTDPHYGAVATPYGSVVTASAHTVAGFSAASGAPLWSYTRSNRELCAIGSGDVHADALDSWTGVHGVMSLFAKNGYCSQVTLTDPTTGERLYQRTSPNEDPGQLFFGSPYVGWMGSDYLELWRHDLVDTIRYGNQPNPVNSGGPHVGCTFTDAAVTADQLATIEHCGSATNLVLNWPTPSDAPDKGDKGWDANHSDPKATIALNADAAVLLSVTADRAAVLVDEPAPAVVIYDSAGTEISRSPAAVSATEIRATAKAGITPVVIDGAHRYALVGHHLLALSSETVTVPAPPPTPQDVADANAPASNAAAADEPATTTADSPVLDWTLDGAIGLPALVAGDLLVPTGAGFDTVVASTGAQVGTIAVDRSGYVGRVDATAVGDIVVEVRGATVVGLAARS